MKLRREAVAQALFPPRRDLNIVPCRRQIANNAAALRVIGWRPQASADEGDADGSRFVVCER